MTPASRHQTRRHPNITQADVGSGLLVFIFAAGPRERFRKFVNHHMDERGRAGQSVQSLQGGMHAAKRRKTLVTTRHPCGDIETRKLLLVYTSFLLFLLS